MLGIILRGIGRVQLVLAALALALVLCEPASLRYGDRIQVALPMIAWGCAALNRTGTEFAVRFTGMMLMLHGSKQGLGDAGRFPNAVKGFGGLTPYVGAGVGVAVPHVEVQPVGQVQTFGYQLTGPAVQLVAGASLPLSDRWSAFGEWKGTWSHHKADLDSGGTLTTNIITNALNLGVTYHF